MTRLLRQRRESLCTGIFLIQHQKDPIRQRNYFRPGWQLLECWGEEQVSSSRDILNEVFSGNIWQPGGLGIIGHT